MKKWIFILAVLLSMTSFTLILSGCSKKYDLTITVNGAGTTSPSAGTYTCEAGTSSTITANPASGWKFDGWSGDASGANKSVSILMDRNKSTTANFSKITYILTLAVNGSGSTNPPIGGHSYVMGSVINISAIPSSDSQFDGWSGNVVSPRSATTSITLTQDTLVTANFSKKPIVFGPINQNIGTSSGSWRLSLNTGDRVDFRYTVAGADVNYAVAGPNNQIVIPSSSKGQGGQSSFTASSPGTYTLVLNSHGILTSSVVTLSYTIYPK